VGDLQVTLPLEDELLDDEVVAAPPAPPFPDEPEDELPDEVVMPPCPPLDVDVELLVAGARRLSS
jgi:hypothetical protein